MNELNKAVRGWTETVTGKMAEFAKRNAALASDVADIKAGFGVTETKEQKQYAEAFREALKEPDFAWRRAQEAQHDLKIIAVGSAADGGLAVPEVLGRRIESRSYQVAPHLQAIGIKQVPSMDYAELFVRDMGAAIAVAENGTRSSTATPEYFRCSPSWGEYSVNVGIYNWALADVMMVEDTIASEAGRQIGELVGTHVFTGNGSGQILGVLGNTPSASADNASPRRGQYVIQSAGNSTSPYTAPNFSSLSLVLDEFAEVYLSSPSFAAAMQHSTWRQLCQFSDPALVATLPEVPRAFGHKVLLTGCAPALAGGAYPVVIGDWAMGYCLATRGLRILKDQVSTKGITNFWISARFGGAPKDSNALKALLV